MKHSEPERTEASHNESIKTEARYTPLTKEAKAHLQAAASLVDDRFHEVQCLIESAISPLEESNRHVGFDLTLSDDEVYRIVRSVEGALSHGQNKVVAPVYARLRGETPYVENGDRPHLTLDEEELWALLEDLVKIGASADLVAHFEVDEERTKNISAAVGALAENVGDRLCEAAGIPVGDETDDQLFPQATAWRERAEKLGRDAVESEGAARSGCASGDQPDDDPYLTSADRLFDVLSTCRAAIGLLADGELENSYGVSPRKVMRKLYEYLEPTYRDNLEARGIDPDVQLDKAGNTVESLALEAKEGGAS